LFLSLKYHLLHPQYIHFRIRELQRAFRLRVLLVHIDVDDPVKALASVTKLACVSDLTLICGWSYEECARYLETFKTYETKPHDLLLGNKSSTTNMEDYTTRVTQILTQIRGVNRTDVLTLTASFGTLRDILQASEEQLSSCPGLGPAKVKRLYDAFHSKFFLNTLVNIANNHSSNSVVNQKKSKAKTPAPAPTTIASDSNKRQKQNQNQEGDDFDIETFL
jgi:DNA excision repair protein ERCC-1